MPNINKNYLYPNCSGQISNNLPRAKDEKVLGSRGSLSRVKKRQLLNYVLDEDATLPRKELTSDN